LRSGRSSAGVSTPLVATAGRDKMGPRGIPAQDEAGRARVIDTATGPDKALIVVAEAGVGYQGGDPGRARHVAGRDSRESTRFSPETAWRATVPQESESDTAHDGGLFGIVVEVEAALV
jgi:hypothetical protein